MGGKQVNIKELRTASVMSRQQFAEYFNIPYRTLQNWELGTRECPQYLLDLMEYKLKNENLFKMSKPVAMVLQIMDEVVKEMENQNK